MTEEGYSAYHSNHILINNSRGFKTLTGHTDGVISVSFNPDGKTLASACGTVKLWDVYTGREIKTLKVYTLRNRVRTVSFSPDAKTFASTSDDGTVILWNFDLDGLLVSGYGLIRGYLQNQNVRHPSGASDKQSNCSSFLILK